jgi:FKBP-type peptidyl-prolyl cis-trans isomerase FkpA
MMNTRKLLVTATAALALTSLTACGEGTKPEAAREPAASAEKPAADTKAAAPAADPKAAAPAAEAPKAAPAADSPQAAPAADSKETGKVTTTASGLKYEILKDAEGPKPAATDQVTVHYRGTLTDGTEFDSSYGRGQPATFPLNRVIKGWTEGVQLMSPGSKYKFTIPPELGYGAAGAGGRIPPNATLIFEVELIKIN